MPKISNLKAVFFDLDDTLFDRKRAQQEIVQVIIGKFPDIFTERDKDIVAEAFFKSDQVLTQQFERGSIDHLHIGKGRMVMFLDLLGLNEEFADEILAIYRESYPKINVPVKGAKYVVKNCSERFKIGIISNGTTNIQYEKLKILDINPLLSCILISQEVGLRKPNPDIFLKGAMMLAVKPEECLYIGDSYKNDVMGAKNAGMLVCWFNPKGLLPFDKGIKPDFEIVLLEEILEILDST